MSVQIRKQINTEIMNSPKAMSYKHYKTTITQYAASVSIKNSLSKCSCHIKHSVHLYNISLTKGTCVLVVVYLTFALDVLVTCEQLVSLWTLVFLFNVYNICAKSLEVKVGFTQLTEHFNGQTALDW